MKDYRVRVGLHDPDSSKYTGSAESWDKAEAACIAAAQSLGVSFSKEPGEAAFYGPKIDFVVRTSSAASGSSAPCRSITRWATGSIFRTSDRTTRPTGRS